METFLKELQQKVIDAGTRNLSISILPNSIFVYSNMGLKSDFSALTIPEAATAIRRVGILYRNFKEVA